MTDFAMHNKRGLKEQLIHRLVDTDLEALFRFLDTVPPRRSLNPIISLFYSGDALLRWRAVTAFGYVVGRLLAAEDMERARVAMRRMMWSLNDESGGIGWGAPEAMAEAMANNHLLAQEYCRILVSYVWEDGNYLEHDPLRRGALWGIGRLAEVEPGLLREAGGVERTRPYLIDSDPYAAGFAAWAMAGMDAVEACGDLTSLAADGRELELYRRHRLSTTTVGRLAKEALERLQCP